MGAWRHGVYLEFIHCDHISACPCILYLKAKSTKNMITRLLPHIMGLIYVLPFFKLSGKFD